MHASRMRITLIRPNCPSWFPSPLPAAQNSLLTEIQRTDNTKRFSNGGLKAVYFSDSLSFNFIHFYIYPCLPFTVTKDVCVKKRLHLRAFPDALDVSASAVDLTASDRKRVVYIRCTPNCSVAPLLQSIHPY